MEADSSPQASSTPLPLDQDIASTPLTGARFSQRIGIVRKAERLRKFILESLLPGASPEVRENFRRIHDLIQQKQMSLEEIGEISKIGASLKTEQFLNHYLTSKKPSFLGSRLLRGDTACDFVLCQLLPAVITQGFSLCGSIPLALIREGAIRNRHSELAKLLEGAVLSQGKERNDLPGSTDSQAEKHHAMERALTEFAVTLLATTFATSFGVDRLASKPQMMTAFHAELFSAYPEIVEASEQLWDYSLFKDLLSPNRVTEKDIANHLRDKYRGPVSENDSVLWEYHHLPEISIGSPYSFWWTSSPTWGVEFTSPSDFADVVPEDGSPPYKIGPSTFDQANYWLSHSSFALQQPEVEVRTALYLPSVRELYLDRQAGLPDDWSTLPIANPIEILMPSPDAKAAIIYLGEGMQGEQLKLLLNQEVANLLDTGPDKIEPYDRFSLVVPVKEPAALWRLLEEKRSQLSYAEIIAPSELNYFMVEEGVARLDGLFRVGPALTMAGTGFIHFYNNNLGQDAAWTQSITQGESGLIYEDKNISDDPQLGRLSDGIQVQQPHGEMLGVALSPTAYLPRKEAAPLPNTTPPLRVILDERNFSEVIYRGVTDLNEAKEGAIERLRVEGRVGVITFLPGYESSAPDLIPLPAIEAGKGKPRLEVLYLSSEESFPIDEYDQVHFDTDIEHFRPGFITSRAGNRFPSVLLVLSYEAEVFERTVSVSPMPPAFLFAKDHEVEPLLRRDPLEVKELVRSGGADEQTLELFFQQQQFFSPTTQSKALENSLKHLDAEDPLLPPNAPDRQAGSSRELHLQAAQRRVLKQELDSLFEQGPPGLRRVIAQLEREVLAAETTEEHLAIFNKASIFFSSLNGDNTDQISIPINDFSSKDNTLDIIRETNQQLFSQLEDEEERATISPHDLNVVLSLVLQRLGYRAQFSLGYESLDGKIEGGELRSRVLVVVATT